MSAFDERHRLTIALAIAIGCVTGVAATAGAATVPDGAVMRVERTIDVAAFARATATRYDDAWNGVERRDDDTIQIKWPSLRLPGAYGHNPLSFVCRTAVSADATLYVDAARGHRTPRAPPASS